MISPRNWLITASCAFAIAALASAPLSAQAAAKICKDGTTSTASGRGACSGHGGVDRAAVSQQRKTVKAETRAAKATAKVTAGAQVTTICMDGTTSNSSGRGTCSGHGGARGAEATSKTTGAPVSNPATAAPTPTVYPPTPTVSVPRASPRAQTRASTNSAVRVGSGGAEDNNPVGAIAQCKDGMYSHATHRRGACGHHGGVATWM